MTSAPARDGTIRVLVRTTAYLYAVGGVGGTLMSVELIRQGAPRGVLLLVVALGAIAQAPLLAGFGARLPRWTLSAVVAVAALALGAGTFLAPDPVVAVAAAAMTVLVSVHAMLFFGWREGWSHVVGAIALQVVALVAVHHVPWLVCAALAVLWLGIAGAVGVLARQASSARVDALTGLANRRGWDGALEDAIDRATRRGDPLSVALVDVDHFKVVNDERGHAAGDALLQAIAAAWVHDGPSDVVLGRRGGDEFAVLMPGLRGEQARVLAETLCAGAPVATSCGVAEHVPGESASELLRRTDSALYAAKAAGRGRTVLSSSPRHGLSRDLLLALDRGEVGVALQPIVELATGQVVGVEALARWQHAEHGAVPPTDFVAVAEESGLIGRLGEAVLRQACTDALDLQRRWGRPVDLAVNVSGRQLVEDGYGQRLRATLAEVGWPPTQLVLEVTESVVDASQLVALRELARLRSFGIRVAVDDFGTGWSSLSRLDELPVDHLKLDRSFLTHVTSSPRRTAMVRALLGLCQELGIDAVAEGVETADQAALLRSLGCPLAQGFLLGRPAPVAELALAGPVRTTAPPVRRPG
ncbi:bifunctional diguanylate cyclase/phosphodiesterase [Cellulomonas sp. SLBN-39]|uniref:putative bifunctional diguanylate cyclase/phosphodiesterase n=1 Tax=Cellulomonas sp. SLBN-39 TaxID=2768446 RepID=UPI0011682AAB|nr:bifunctional diguanylate cyclase/phosphodiesterase [Cellulomonas sp. SLBN-39]TQL02575.1 diguanylate cyclase/phosphodiesterase [Cellulomonas sp. SLBN-39]